MRARKPDTCKLHTPEHQGQSTDKCHTLVCSFLFKGTMNHVDRCMPCLPAQACSTAWKLISSGHGPSSCMRAKSASKRLRLELANRHNSTRTMDLIGNGQLGQAPVLSIGATFLTFANSGRCRWLGTCAFLWHQSESLSGPFWRSRGKLGRRYGSKLQTYNLHVVACCTALQQLDNAGDVFEHINWLPWKPGKPTDSIEEPGMATRT